MFCWKRSSEPYIIPIRKSLCNVNTIMLYAVYTQAGQIHMPQETRTKQPPQQDFKHGKRATRYANHPAPSRSNGSLFLLSPLLSRLNRDDTTRDVTELARDRLRDAASDGRARKLGRIEGGRDVAGFCDGW